MFITLTNANPSHRNKTIVLNTDAIVSVHRAFAKREDESLEEVTFIHCPPHGTWEVLETLEEVTLILNQVPLNNKKKKEFNKKS